MSVLLESLNLGTSTTTPTADRRIVTTGLNVNLLPALSINETFIWVVQPATGAIQIYRAYYDGVQVWTTPLMTSRGKI